MGKQIQDSKFRQTWFVTACYSGTWAFYCCNKGVTGFECLSACRMDQSAFDTGSFNTTMNIKEGIFHGSPPI